VNLSGVFFESMIDGVAINLCLCSGANFVRGTLWCGLKLIGTLLLQEVVKRAPSSGGKTILAVCAAEKQRGFAGTHHGTARCFRK
jgi:hypothetical protein